MGKKTNKTGKNTVKNNQQTGIKNLTAVHRRCIEMLVHREGWMTDGVIAEAVGVAPETLSRWKKSKVFSEALDKAISEEERWRRKQYRTKANRAAERLAELMESKHPPTAIAAVKEMLRLAGDAAPEEEKTAEAGVGIVILPDIKYGGNDG